MQISNLLFRMNRVILPILAVGNLASAKNLYEEDKVKDYIHSRFETQSNISLADSLYHFTNVDSVAIQLSNSVMFFRAHKLSPIESFIDRVFNSNSTLRPRDTLVDAVLLHGFFEGAKDSNSSVYGLGFSNHNYFYRVQGDSVIELDMTDSMLARGLLSN